MMDDGFENLQDSAGNFTVGEGAASIILLIVVIAMFTYHYVVAWKVLPGAWLGWGLSSGGVDEIPPSHAENRFLQYFITITSVTLYVILYASFAYSRGDLWNYHFILLSWVMSLIASFDEYFSIAWLGITTGVFLQGVGAYSFQAILSAAVESN